MHLRYDEELVEAAVLLCATGRRRGASALQVARFNREREKLYDIPDPDDRNEAFFRLHLEWFREWGLEGFFTGPLAEFPILSEALRILAFRKSRFRSDDGAELYVKDDGARSGVVAVRTESLLQEAELAAFLRHELLHLSDMVDPDFAYQPELRVRGPSLNQQRLARERYRLLWDVTIDGRLTQAGRPAVVTRDQRWLEFTGVFAFWPEARQQKVFDCLWAGSAPTHQNLEALVCEPLQFQTASGMRPGAPCPLCGFPTFAWAAESSLAERVAEVIRSEFPQWTPAQGACARCAEIYRAQSQKTTVAI